MSHRRATEYHAQRREQQRSYWGGDRAPWASQYCNIWRYESFVGSWLNNSFSVLKKNKKYKASAALGAWDWIKKNTTKKEFYSNKDLYDDIVEFCNKEKIYEMRSHNELLFIGEIKQDDEEEEDDLEEKTYDSDPEYEQGDDDNRLLLTVTNYDCNVCLREPLPNQLYMFSENIVGICKRCWRQGYRFNHDGTEILTANGDHYPHTNVNYYPPEEDEAEEKEEEYDSDASTVIAGDNNT